MKMKLFCVNLESNDQRRKMSEGIWNWYFLAFIGVCLSLYWLLSPGYRPARVQNVRRTEA